MDTGRGGARRCSRVLVVDRERERAEGIGTEGEIRESERVRGAAWRLQGVAEASRKAGGGLGVCPRAPATRLRLLARGGRRQGREAAVGWASGRSWPAGPATGKWPR